MHIIKVLKAIHHIYSTVQFVLNFQHGQNFYPNAVYPPPPPPPPPMQQPGGMMPPAGEVCQISVPNAAVGAIIGAGGSNIKQMMRESGAFVNVSVYIISKQ